MDNKDLKQKLDLKIDTLIATQNIIIQKYNYEAWLANFQEEHKSLAYRLLYGFIFISEAMTDLMLVNAISSLSCDIENPASHSDWRSFIDSVSFAPVRDNVLNFSDSGNLFVGKVKKLLNVDESRLIGNLEEIIDISLHRKVILIDDFVGTGDQFVGFIQKLSGSSKKFHKKCLENLIYIPLISTHRGSENITVTIPEITFRPLHILTEEYCVDNPNAIYWRDLSPNGKTEKIHQIIEISRSLNIPEDLIFGYKNLGLGIAFQHHIPDATLPIFTHSSSEWVPLVGV